MSYRCPKSCDCDTCVINDWIKEANYEVEQQFDYCETLHFNRNIKYLEPKEYEKIFTTVLTEFNAIQYRTFLFLMIKIDKSDDGSDYHSASDEDIDIQISKQIKRHSGSICKRNIEISDSYVYNSLKKAQYKFVMSSKIDLTNNKSCPILAFRLLKDFEYLSVEEPLFSFFKKYKIIESLLICAIELTREDETPFTSKKLLLKASLGSIITYKSVQFAMSEKFDYYFSRAASVSLIFVYKSWGFNLGIPFLNLNFVLNKYFDILSKGKESEKEIALYNIIKGEIQTIFQKNYRVCKSILGVNLDEWKNAVELGSSAFEVESKAVADFIYDKKSSSFNMFLDLTKSSSDVDNLYNYSYRRFGKFLSYNKFYEKLLNDPYIDIGEELMDLTI